MGLWASGKGNGSHCRAWGGGSIWAHGIVEHKMEVTIGFRAGTKELKSWKNSLQMGCRAHSPTGFLQEEAACS